ncbi:hypothetical protein DPMN_160605 [Dreissena polymorpha]|uniref:Profilin n=1 Tax=Dreissena polymorpha TaxID=45954 RepID=A0A9D4EN48_DREPO|nr:hypothetical protein DPMN_160605 [Dreissena polymorpha]
MDRGRDLNINGDGDIRAELQGDSIGLSNFRTNGTLGNDGGYVNHAMEADSDDEEVKSKSAESVKDDDQENNDVFDKDSEKVGTGVEEDNSSPTYNNGSKSSADFIDTEERLHSMTDGSPTSIYREDGIDTEERRGSTSDGTHTTVINSERVSNKAGVNISLQKKGLEQALHGDPPYTELSSLLEWMTTSGIVECAAFISLDGSPVATSAECAVTKGEGIGIIRAIQGGYKGLTRITISGKEFTCSRNKRAERLIGKSEYYFMCAFKMRQFILVAISDTEKQGSSICEITRMLNGNLI